MSRRPITPAYIFFYLLFSTDVWRLLLGGSLALALTPHVSQPNMTVVAVAMMYVMMISIGWAVTAVPAKWIVKKLKKWILGERI